MEYYESAEHEKHCREFATPDERAEYKRMVKEEAKTIMGLPLSARVAHYKKAEQEYGNEHMKNLVSEVKKQRQRSEEMEM